MTDKEGLKLKRNELVHVINYHPEINTSSLIEAVERANKYLEARVLEVSERTDEAKVVFRVNGKEISALYATFHAMNHFTNPGVKVEWVKFFNLAHPQNKNSKNPNEYDDSYVMEE